MDEKRTKMDWDVTDLWSDTVSGSPWYLASGQVELRVLMAQFFLFQHYGAYLFLLITNWILINWDSLISISNLSQLL